MNFNYLLRTAPLRAGPLRIGPLRIGPLRAAIIMGAALVFIGHSAAPSEVSLATADEGRQLEVQLDKHPLPGLVRSALGVTRLGTSIPCFVADEDFDPHTSKFRILLIGGLDGKSRSVSAALRATEWFQSLASDSKFRERYTISCVPCANPDGWSQQRGAANLAGGKPASGYPPSERAYNSPNNPESQYLWRWIGMHAPDLVVDIRAGDAVAWRMPPAPSSALRDLTGRLQTVTLAITADESQGETRQGDGLVAALNESKPCETGIIPGLQLCVGDASVDRLLNELLESVKAAGADNPSPARRQLQQRVSRSPIEIVRQLSEHYGRELESIAYIPSLAVVGRIRLAKLTGDEKPLHDAIQLASPYLQGEKSTFGSRVAGSSLSGHLIFTELARATGDERYITLAKRAADLAFDDSGQLRPAMPYHNEMSDSVFMGCAILAEVGQLTGDSRYEEMCLRHMRFMQKHCLRDDGLYRHSPLDESAWGRGNGFPALGLAISLSALSDSFSGRELVLESFQNHMRALKSHQDPQGAWHQIIDRPESYRELTATCMITFAMLRGVRRGWLPREEYQPVIDRAWRTIKTRIAPNGRLVDVCTGTGKQLNRRAYYDRTAILGKDPRGGAMALMVATEMAASLRNQ